MTEHHTYQPGDIVLDNYLTDGNQDERDDARAKLAAFLEWQMRIVIRQLGEEADSLARRDHATLDSAQPPP